MFHKFWDSSAIVPLIVNEKKTVYCSTIYREDPTILGSMFCAVEIHSALCRRQREGALTIDMFEVARQRLIKLEEAMLQISFSQNIKDRAIRLLSVHPLRAFDALHLASALVAVEERTKGFAFVTLDARLAEAAKKEGFLVFCG